MLYAMNSQYRKQLMNNIENPANRKRIKIEIHDHRGFT